MDAMFFIVLGATLASFLLTLLFGRFVIPMLCALHAGQSIREVGPQWHNTKAGTPTMGGIMFIAAIILCTVGFGWKSMTENRDYTHLYVLALALCYGLVGFADDFVKVKLKRNLGLTAIQKFLLQLVVAVVFLFVLKNSGDLSCDLYIPFWNLDLEIPLISMAARRWRCFPRPLRAALQASSAITSILPRFSWATPVRCSSAVWSAAWPLRSICR
mgnify:CR=1 FL=1